MPLGPLPPSSLRPLAAVVFFVSVTGAALARAAGETLAERDTLLGGAWGARLALQEHGLVPALTYTADVVGVAAGGIHRRAEYLDSVDVSLAADLEKLLRWPGASAYVYAFANHGSSPTDNSGEL